MFSSTTVALSAGASCVTSDVTATLLISAASAGVTFAIVNVEDSNNAITCCFFIFLLSFV